MATKTISKSVYNTNQSWYFDETLNIDGKKIHFLIRKNAYEFQSGAAAKLWDGQKWNIVFHIPGEKLKMSRSYVEKNVTETDFAADRTELLRVTKAILN